MEKYHKNCINNFSPEDFLKAKNSLHGWSCTQCNSELFPLNNDFNDNEHILRKDEEILNNSLSNINFNFFNEEIGGNNINDNKLEDFDPDKNFFQSEIEHIREDSKYYNVTTYTKETKIRKVKKCEL